MDPLIGAKALHSALGEAGLVVVDCRFDLLAPGAGYARYREGRIPDARYANLDSRLAGARGRGEGRHPLPAPESFAATLRELGISRSSRVVAYDDAGGAVAARLWWMLRWVGHAHAAVLDGGIGAWTGAGYALETAPPARPSPGDFEVEGDDTHASAVATAELERLLAADAAVLLDARAPERYAGETEPIDAVAGHVPGARNLPFTSLLGPDGRFEPPAALRSRFEAVLGGRDARDVVAMCGSGVTACHLLLAMARAGLEDGRLYPGSWSAWIADPARPVATSSAADS